ncbi:hypothetical protein Pelo_225 [Pelomyxa schiedti]|nr:hypothetical protein Pelo_225 [Pelomyxa schiedti]
MANSDGGGCGASMANGTGRMRASAGGLSVSTGGAAPNPVAKSPPGDEANPCKCNLLHSATQHTKSTR